MDSELYNFIDPKRIHIDYTDTDYVNTQSFTHWLYTNLFLYYINLVKTTLIAVPHVLIIDGYGSHYNGIKNVNLTQENLFVHYLTPHSSDQTQPLNFSIFGPTKQYMSNYKYNNLLSR